jgi:hypothetical protein
MPPIRPPQPSPYPSRNRKPYLHLWLLLIKLYTPLNIQLRWRKLPDTAVRLLRSEASTRHCAQEVDPRNFSYVAAGAGCEEEGVEHFQGCGGDAEEGLSVELGVEWWRSSS